MTPKLGWKGFSKDLMCKHEKFEIGITYSKKNVENPSLCSNEGYHYCNKLRDVYTYYSVTSTNRFFLIEILGNFTDDSGKSITTSFRIIKEVSPNAHIDAVGLYYAEMANYEHNKSYRDSYELSLIQATQEQTDKDNYKRELVKEIKQEEVTSKLLWRSKIAKKLNLDIVKEIQTAYPHIIVGGSIGLFLHGINLDRWAKGEPSDIDLISPYYTLIESIGNLKIEEIEEESSGKDFEYTLSVYGDNGPIQIDLAIDPKSTYKYIDYEGFRYKVNRLENIWAAKLKYHKPKHIKDLEEALLK